MRARRVSGAEETKEERVAAAGKRSLLRDVQHDRHEEEQREDEQHEVGELSAREFREQTARLADGAAEQSELAARLRELHGARAQLLERRFAARHFRVHQSRHTALVHVIQVSHKTVFTRTQHNCTLHVHTCTCVR